MLAAAVAAARGAWAQGLAPAPDSVKLNRLSILSSCFDSLLKSPSFPEDPKRTLDILDFPQTVADRYKIHNVELQQAHFLSTEPAWLRELRAALDRAKSQLTQINLEFGALNVSTSDPVVRLETVDLTKQWISHAADLGCTRVMLNAGALTVDVRTAAIESLKTLGGYGKAKNVRIVIENKDLGGPMPPLLPGLPPRPGNAPWETVLEAIRGAGIYASPNTGNFPAPEARITGLRALWPLSSGNCHCRYAPERFSEADAIAVSKQTGYKGLYAIETTRANGPDPFAAVQTVLDELLRDI